MTQRKRATVSSMTDAFDDVFALSEKDGKDITMFITTPAENVDEHSIGEEEINPGTAQF